MEVYLQFVTLRTPFFIGNDQAIRKKYENEIVFDHDMMKFKIINIIPFIKFQVQKTFSKMCILRVQGMGESY